MYYTLLAAEMEVEMVSNGTLQPNYVYIFPDRTAGTVSIAIVVMGCK